MSWRPLLIIAPVAAGLAVLIGLATYFIMQTAYETQPLWSETVPRRLSYAYTLYWSERYGVIFASWEMIQYLRGGFLRELLLFLLFPGSLAWPHAHLLVNVPVLALFLAIFGWTVYRRSGRVAYAVGSIALFAALPGFPNHRWGFGSLFIEWPAMLFVGAGVLCLLNAMGRPGHAWLRWSAIFLSLAVITRMNTAVTILVMAGPVLLLHLIGRYRESRSPRPVLVALAHFLAPVALITVVPIALQLEWHLDYYFSPNAYGLRNTLFRSVRTTSKLWLDFVGRPIVLVGLSAFILTCISLRGSVADWRKVPAALVGRIGRQELGIAWSAVGFLLFLLASGYWSDVPKEVMYAVPGFMLGVLSPVSLPRADRQRWADGSLRVAVVLMTIAAVALFWRYATEQVDRAVTVTRADLEWRESQFEMAKRLNELPGVRLWQSYTYPDWGYLVSTIATFSYGRPVLNAGADFFSNSKNYWDTFYPGLSVSEIQERLYARTVDCVDATVILKDPARKPTDMEDYSYSIAAYMARRVQTDGLWYYVGELGGKPFGSELVLFAKTTPSRAECFERLMLGLTPDGQGKEHMYSAWRAWKDGRR